MNTQKTKQSYFFISLLIALLVCTHAVHAQRFTASASSATVGVGEQVEITFELKGNGAGFRAPSFSGFNVLMGPSQSSQMSFVNGSMSQSVAFTYVIQAVKEGTYKIGSASIETEGKKVQSNELTIKVVKGSAPPPAQGGGQRQQAGQEGVDSKSVFIKASVNKSSVYRGEAVVVTYKLCTRVNLVNYGLNKLPSFTGFYSQDIDNSKKQLEFASENIDGVGYKTAVIKQIVLFPQRSGTLTLDAMEGEVVARVQARRQQQGSPFDFFFNDPFFNNSVQDVQVKIKSQPLRINVRELPVAPAGFNSAVGLLSITASVDKSAAKAHDAINLRIKISGNGNIKLLDPPAIDYPPDFETYDPKVNSNATASTDGVSGSKSFEYLMIPRNAGEYKITVGSFTYFDPAKNRYQTIPGSTYHLNIAKGDGKALTNTSGISKNEIEYLGKDIRFIKTNTPLFVAGHNMFYGSAWFYILLALPVLLAILLFFARNRYAESMRDTASVKSRRASRVAMKRLVLAKKLLDQQKDSEFIDEMFRVLWGFVGDKLSIPVSQLSKENVSEALTQRGVSVATITGFIQTLGSCEIARFARSMAEPNAGIYDKGLKIISKLEEEIK